MVLLLASLSVLPKPVAYDLLQERLFAATWSLRFILAAAKAAPAWITKVSVQRRTQPLILLQLMGRTSLRPENLKKAINSMSSMIPKAILASYEITG